MFIDAFSKVPRTSSAHRMASANAAKVSPETSATCAWPIIGTLPPTAANLVNVIQRVVWITLLSVLKKQASACVNKMSRAKSAIDARPATFILMKKTNLDALLVSVMGILRSASSAADTLKVRIS